MGSWFQKYLLEGQQLDEKHVEKINNFPSDPSFSDYILIKYRKFVAVLIPLVLIHAIWWATAIRHDFFPWYKDYWHMPVTMIVGALISGMTAEGAGAVAFPVMTLILHLAPSIARDFSLMIQSVGMMAAMVCVVFMKVKFEVRAVIFGILGAIPGFIFGVHYIDPLFSGPQKKMMFVSIWTAFAFALGLLNAQKKRSTFVKIPEFYGWKALVLFITGIVGGVFDAFAGSGIDICMFSIVTLLFRVSEKTATPTTMILKGIVSAFGFWYRGVMMGDISDVAWKYFTCTIPVVATMAPVGSFLGSHLHRQVIAALIYVLEAASMIGFLLTKPGWLLIVTSCMFVYYFFLFDLSTSKCYSNNHLRRICILHNNFQDRGIATPTNRGKASGRGKSNAYLKNGNDEIALYCSCRHGYL
uniref:Membrane transporter protein n=1 Tax=Caenorhabditis japonica TaxID=281687 RepID=A0A8R1DL68_CAEJA